MGMGVMVENFNWLGNWFNTYFLSKALDQIGILFTTFLVITLLFKKLSINQNNRIENKIKIPNDFTAQKEIYDLVYESSTTQIWRLFYIFFNICNSL